MSNQFLKLRRSAVPGKIPETGSLDLGEIALNTHDGLAFMKKSVGGNESVVVIGNSTGSFTGSFSGEFTGSLLGTSSWAYNAVTASTADDFYVRGNITGSNAIFSGTVTAQRLVVQTISSSVIYSSGSNIFGDELTDTQQFTGSVTITGSLTVNGPSTFNSRVTANNLTGSLFGTASQAITASFALSGNGPFTGSFTGSFFGNGAGLTNISASSVVGLNLSLISSGSVTASTDPAYGFRVNANSQFSGSTQITGSLGVTGSVSISGSVGSVFTTNIDTMILTGSFLQNGSTFITGTLSVFGGITGSLFGTSSWAVSSSFAQTASLAILAPAYTTTASFNQFSSSYYIDSASFNNSISLLSGSFLSTSASYASASGSLSTRVTNLESTASIVSASYASASGSLSTRTTNLESTASVLTLASASFSIVSASYASASGSLSTRVTTLENASASFAQDSGSNSNRLTNLESTASVLTQASASFSSSIAYLSSSFIAFSQSYNTGSFTGSFNGQATLTGSFTGKFYGDLSGSFSGSVANIDGATNYIARFDTPNSVDSSVIYQSASHIAINETSFTTDNPEALYVFQTNPTSINVITGKGNTNNYLQLNIQNTNQGVQASSDIVATANNGNENSNYIDMGINSQNFNTNFIGSANDAYVYSIANNLHIGNAATNGTHLGLFVGGTDVEANNKLQLNAVGKHIMSGSLAITGSLSVQQGVTASLFGTASWAVSASHAPTALSSSYAITASYALQAATASFATTASYIANVVYTTGSQTISGFKTFTDRTTFNNHIVMDGTGSTNYTLAFKQPSALNFYSGDYTEIGAFGGTELDFNFGQIAGGYRRFAFNVANLSLSTPRTYQFPDKTGLLLIDDITSGSVATSSFSITSSYSLNAISAISASYAATASSADSFFVRQNITASNALIYGSLTAQTIYAQYITASTELITGSTKFGTQLTDTHQFTGSVTITGSLSLNNDPVVTQIPYNNFSQSIQSRATKLEATSSILTSASASFAVVSSSFATTSASLSIRTTDLESTASILTLASASFATVSSSFATTSASLSTRTTDLESTASVLTSASASFAIVSSSYASSSGSLSTRITTLEQASASFSLVSASYSAFSQSYNTGSFTGSFTGVGNLTGSLFGTSSWANNAVTSSYILQAVSASFATTASYSVSSSYAYNADLLDGKDSSTFATTGSNIFVGNQTVTGSLFTSGSNMLIGSTTLTGSLRITGSTIQTGNNTLIGNTSLSGSLTISGSQGAGVPSINIYGDIEQRGYTRYLPVNTNINTSISASYIFVSGSTEDLYFSQNSKGYSNVTRLRWLEGNLYTGLLNGGLISTQSSTVYQISSGSGIIVNLNASFNDNPYPTIQYLNWNTLSASIAPLTASYQQAFVGIDSTNNIYAQGTPFSNGQFDNIINIGNVLFQNQSTINGVKTQPSTAYGFEQAQNVFNRAFGPLKLSGYTLAPSGSSTGSLVVGSGTAYSPGANYSVDPNEPYYAVDNGTSVSKIFRYYQSGSTWVYNTNAGAGFATIDPTRYSNNGVLTNVPSPVGSNWTIQRAFWFPNSVTKAIVVYYGNAYYGSESEAIANINIEPFVEAPNTAANAIYLGAIIINGDGIFTDAADFTIVPGGLFRQVGGSGGGGSLVTQTLAGLSDVSISGPTNGQPLVYKSTSGKWENSSTLTADLTGNASTATTASFAVTASYVLQAVSSSFATTASYVQNAQSASYILQAVSASFASQASTASYVLQAVSASFATNASTASYVLNAISASYAATASSADSLLVRQSITASNALIIGTLTAQTIVAQVITSSTDFVTGSTKFGTLLTNTHQFTGSVTVTGSLSLNDSPVITSATLIPFSSSVSTRLVTLENASSSFAFDSGSNSNRLTRLETTASVLTTASASFAIVSSSFATTSASLSTRTTNLESTASILTTASASFAIVSSSYASASGSLSTRVTSLETASGSFSTRVTILENASASFAQQSGSNSIRLTNLETTASVLTTASASFSIVSSSFSSTSQSVSTRLNIIETSYATTGSNTFNGNQTINGRLNVTSGITGSLFGTSSWSQNAVTSSYALQAISASFATTSSYSLTASVALNVPATASYALQALSASYAVTASYAIAILDQGYNFTQAIAAATWSINHNLNSFTPLVDVYNTTYNIIIPASIASIDANNTQVTFATATAGYAILSKGSGLVSNATSASQATSASYSISSSFAATASLVLGTISSASYATNADTASTGVNFRISNTLTLDATLTDYASINSSVVGSNNLFTQATSSYTSGFFKYTAASGLNARSGEVIAVWNGNNVTFTDNSTTDVGSTTAVTASVSLVSGDVQFNMQTNSSGWRIKSLATFM